MIDDGIADKKEIDAFSTEVCVPIVDNISKQVTQHISNLRVSQLITLIAGVVSRFIFTNSFNHFNQSGSGKNTSRL